jgi:hypothetical protein
MVARLFVCVCAVLVASGASSAYRTPEMSGPPRWSRVNWPVPEIRWTCVEPGFQEIDLGGRACLSTPNGYRRATCERVDNMTNWRITDEACPSRLPQPE